MEYTNKMNKIDIKALRQACNRIFDYMEWAGITEVGLEEDMYWHISSPEKYNLSKDVEFIGISQLYDDLEFVMSAVSEDDMIPPIMLIHIAPLLEYLAYNDKCTVGLSNRGLK